MFPIIIKIYIFIVQYKYLYFINRNQRRIFFNKVTYVKRNTRTTTEVVSQRSLFRHCTSGAEVGFPFVLLQRANKNKETLRINFRFSPCIITVNHFLLAD